MDVLGLIGQQYMFLLLVVLFLGFGLGTWSIIKYLFSNKESKALVKVAVNSNSNKEKNIETGSKITKIIGGINMNNGWLKLGLFSLIGLIISFSILGFISSNNSYNMNTSNGMNMNDTMNTQGTMTMTTNNNGMNMNSTGANTMNMSGQVINSSYDANIQNQLYQMQMQLNQMQMQLQNMMNSNNGQMQMQTPTNNTNSNSNSNSSGSMSSMPMM